MASPIVLMNLHWAMNVVGARSDIAQGIPKGYTISLVKHMV